MNIWVEMSAGEVGSRAHYPRIGAPSPRSSADIFYKHPGRSASQDSWALQIHFRFHGQQDRVLSMGGKEAAGNRRAGRGLEAAF